MLNTTTKWVAATLLLCAWPVFETHAAPSSDAVILHMDNRFSGFDTIAYIQKEYAFLAPQAESISHWAAYYSINPLFLINLARERSMAESLTIESVKIWAKALGELNERQKMTSESLPDRDTWMASRLAEAVSISGEMASRVINRTVNETISAGLSVRLEKSAETPPALDLPFSQPQAWQFNGVHTWTGDDDGSAMSSLDFAQSWSQNWGDDTSADWVAAAHDGQVDVYSSCYLQVLHDSGWATRYYHLDNLQVQAGQRVLVGEALGNYANDKDQALCSGGHSNGPHVHFALLRDGQYYSLEGIALSGYMVHPGDSSYDTARHRMWLEKRSLRYYAFDEPIARQPGDNVIDYRFNGMWYSTEHNGHGINVDISEYPQESGSRQSVFLAFYTYDDEGLANFYAGNRDFDRWRSDESLVIEMLQMSNGDFSDLSPVDFDDEKSVRPAGEIELQFFGCKDARMDFNLDERSSGQEFSRSLEMVKLIGVPDHVCDAESLPLPAIQKD